MNRKRLLGVVAAAVVLVVGAVSFGSSASAAPVGIDAGPSIVSTAPYTAITGTSFDLVLSTAAPNAGPGYNGYQMSVVYNSASVTANSATDIAGAAGGIWAGTGLCPSPPSLTDTLGGALVPPQKAVKYACITTGGNVLTFGNLVKANFTANVAGVTGFHMVTPTDAPTAAACGTICTYVTDVNGYENSLYKCGSVPTVGPPLGTGACGPLPVPGSTAADNVMILQQPAPVLSVTKTVAPGSVVAGGQAFAYTITVSNAATPATTATGVSVSDTLPAAVPIANVTLPVGCTNVGQVVTCTAASLAPGASATFVLNVTKTDPTAGNTCPVNTATATDTNSPTSAPASGSATLCIIPPAVAWSKTPASQNAFLTTGVQTFTFNEVMTNQGDPNGLGAFSFDIHYDPTIFANPVVDTSPAAALFAAAGRTLICSPTILGNGIDHIACVSTGPLGVGPTWVGPKVMAIVTLTPLEIVTEQIRPNKENGLVTAVKDTATTVANTCGQPLNDGTIQPLPGQPECQGLPLQGVGPGGVLNDSMTVITLRRLEGDITKDCAVTIADAQLEASKFGMSVGNLLYNVFYDVNSPLQHGDGEIDILDIQFVFGRLGSTCATPIPAQPAAALP